MRNGIIRITRKVNEDAIILIKKAAKTNNLHLIGNMRWRGNQGPFYRDIGTKEGVRIIINEPN